MQAQAAQVWPSLQIGSPYGGGYYAGDISYNESGVATHRLIVAPRATGQANPPINWGLVRNDIPGGLDNINGANNSNILNSASFPAAQFCKSLTIGGFTDWYLPAYFELDICYYSLKPTTESNRTIGANTNPYSVPSRASNPYTTTVPPQTIANNFKQGGSEAFIPTFYWTSSNGGIRVWAQLFTNGQSANWFSDRNDFPVRAIRKIPI